MASGTFTPYSTVETLFGARPTWIQDELDVARIQAYQTYEQIYWNVPDIFQVSLRGSNELPIYVPSGRVIVDTTNRYVGAAFGFSVSAPQGGSSPDSQAATLALADFMRREKFKSKFNGNKRYGLMRGDALWHVTADEDKAEGSRISLTAIDPAMYFPITDPEDVDSIIGAHLVELIETPDGPRIRRLTYRKIPRVGQLPQISVEDGLFEVDKWGGPGFSPATVITPPTVLPDPITSIPVYHWKNFEEPNNPFGSSELRGLERIMAGLNQTMSDEDLTLALEGIGVYATDSSEPIDPRTKQRVPWRMGPGRVVHYDGERFDRLTGATNLAGSYGEHYNRLRQALFESGSTPEVAVGKVDVSVAQSGIALRLQLAPMLAKAGEKNDALVDTHGNLGFDLLTMWYPAYEDAPWTRDDIRVDCNVGDAVPVDRVQRFAELRQMWEDGVIDTAFYRTECAKLGYVFPDGMANTAAAEYDKRNQDEFAARVAEETADDDTAA